MAVRSRRLTGPALLSTTTSLIYTVPSGRTLILRTVQVYNGSATLEAELRLFINGTTSVNRALKHLLAVETTATLTPYWILNPGDTLWAQGSQSTIRMTTFGSLLLGAPE